MNKENDWNYKGVASKVEGPIEKVTHEEMATAGKAMKPGKAAGPPEVCAEMIFASGEVEIGVMRKLFQHMLDGKGMPQKWQTNVLVPIFKEKRDVRNCNTNRGVKLLEHAMKIVKRVLARRIRKLINIDTIQFGCMSGRGMTDALFVVRRMQRNMAIRRKNCI